MFARLGALVSRYWYLVILFWLVLLAAVRLVAPPWDAVTNDGDFAFLPADMPSVVGQRLTQDAFPGLRAKSQLAVVVARQDAPLSERDLRVGDELSKRIHNLLGVARYHAARQLLQDQERMLPGAEAVAELSLRAEQSLQAAQAAFDEALRLDPEFAIAAHNRGILHRHLGHMADGERDTLNAVQLAPDLAEAPRYMLPQEAADLPLLDVWTRDNEVFGTKLVSDDKQALLIVLHLDNEFMAADNIRVLEVVRKEIESARRLADEIGADRVVVGVSGSAAVGADLLVSAAESIQNTEFFTIGLVVVILAIVYRAPLVIVVPLITIGVSLSIATGILALLTQLDEVFDIPWWDFKVFNTTRIFVVVILFGAGTDFCLFLIARLREELGSGADCDSALKRSVTGVSSALIASAFTTIVGLGMMFFADFGKFRSSGPAIGLCLVVALVACLTLAPALLRAMGTAVFWPHRYLVSTSRLVSLSPRTWVSVIWTSVARAIVARPGAILSLSLVILAPFAWLGINSERHVTFDLLAELDSDRVSIRGGKLLQAHFSVGESGPVIVLAKQPGAKFGNGDDAGTKSLVAIRELTVALSNVVGVTAVRSLAEPLGDAPQRLSILSAAGRRKLFLREHRLTKSIFVAQSPELAGDVTRFELVLDVMPFSRDALDALNRIEDRLREESNDLNSFWSRAEFAFTGTTAGIRDLRKVTRSDQRRIQLLVVLAVLAVLWLVLRRFVICLYLISSVVLSYLVTIGVTGLFFHWMYGATFDGLDWKVPIFLFVILVAVGEDYNIYLVTRVFEEQAKLGPFAGLREALVKTGGIITSCGLIMAGTFISMTSGTLRGVVELGFALSLGVLLDTFVVRTVLVPAFLALYCRFTSGPLIRGGDPPRNLPSAD